MSHVCETDLFFLCFWFWFCFLKNSIIITFSTIHAYHIFTCLLCLCLLYDLLPILARCVYLYSKFYPFYGYHFNSFKALKFYCNTFIHFSFEQMFFQRKSNVSRALSLISNLVCQFSLSLSFSPPQIQNIRFFGGGDKF